MPKIRNLTKGALILHGGFDNPVTLESGKEIEVTAAQLFNPEILRLSNAGILGVTKDPEPVKQSKPKVKQEEVKALSTETEAPTETKSKTSTKTKTKKTESKKTETKKTESKKTTKKSGK